MLRFIEPASAREKWQATVELAFPHGDIVDESGSGRSVFVGTGATKEEARDDVCIKLGQAILKYGWPATLAISDEQHARLWKLIQYYAAVTGGDPLQQNPAKDAAAKRINELLSRIR